MTAAYILIVTSWVYGGSVTTFQEFYSKEKCESARAAVETTNPRYAKSACVPK
mgnify:CR=1 FL=1